MVPSKILKAAELFEQTIKEASIRGNMAKRIMFSLLSHLTPIGESSRSYYTHGAIDVKALRQLIPGAKEILEYGIMACIEEISWHSDIDSVKKLKNISSLGEQKYTLKALILFFNRNDWQQSYGGENWKKIAETLLDIKIHLDNGLEARNNYELDREIKELMSLSSYLNILDGLMHNTGSIMDKMINIESNMLNKEPDLEGKDFRAIRRLMDVKELKDPDDVLQEIMPILEKETDTPLTMKDWIHAARRRKHDYKGSAEDRQKKLDKIRVKKDMMSVFPPKDFARLKERIQNLSRTAENKIPQKVTEEPIRSLILNFQYLINTLLESPEISSEIMGKINIQSQCFDVLNDYISKLRTTPSEELNNNLWVLYKLIDTAEEAFNSITD